MNKDITISYINNKQHYSNVAKYDIPNCIIINDVQRNYNGKLQRVQMKLYQKIENKWLLAFDITHLIIDRKTRIDLKQFLNSEYGNMMNKQ